MNLKEYLFYKDMSVKEFAKQAGFHETYMSAIMNKKRAASKKALKLIEFATGGWVKQDTVFQETKMPEGFKADVLPFPETEPEIQNDPMEEIALGS